MPYIAIKMYPGRSEELKKEIAVKTRDFLAQEMGMEEKFFSVSVEDIEKDQWQEEVVDKIAKDDLYVESNFLQYSVHIDRTFLNDMKRGW